MWEAEQPAPGEPLFTVYELELKEEAGEERLGAHQPASEGSVGKSAYRGSRQPSSLVILTQFPLLRLSFQYAYCIRFAFRVTYISVFVKKNAMKKSGIIVHCQSRKDANTALWLCARYSDRYLHVYFNPEHHPENPHVTDKRAEPKKDLNAYKEAELDFQPNSL